MSAAEQGVDLNRYMVIPRVLVVITREDKLLLLKGADDKRLWAGLYNGVGGHLEQGEDPRSDAHREVFEETGLSITDLLFCGIVFVNTNVNPGICIFIFTGEYKTGNLAESREGMLEWVDISALSTLPLVADMPVLLPKILSHKSGSDPFFAHSRYDENENLVVTFE
jgi:8-oxo-dGTP diphosphatase